MSQHVTGKKATSMNTVKEESKGYSCVTDLKGNQSTI